MTDKFSVQPFAPVAAPTPRYSIFVRDLVMVCTIGVHKHERKAPQRVRVNIDLSADGAGPAAHDELSEVVCYEDIIIGVKTLTAQGHINLVETLAERIAAMCLSDARVESARVRVEKLDVFADAASVGVEIERVRSRR